MSTAEEFKARNRKDVLLPSGLTVTIRRIESRDLVIKYGYLPEPGGKESKAADDPEKAKRFMSELISMAVVSPKVVLGNAGPGEMNVEDFWSDAKALSDAVISFSLGFGEVALESFRPSGDITPDPSPRESVSSPTP